LTSHWVEGIEALALRNPGCAAAMGWLAPCKPGCAASTVFSHGEATALHCRNHGLAGR
jgi:hypothetical protein